MLFPPAGDDWVALSAEPLPFEHLATWPVLAGCGAVVVFAGTVRDHAEGRPGVLTLEYEAYADVATLTMQAIALEMRGEWPCLGRVALLHRTGLLEPTDIAVVVSVSAPHRAEAFEAARFGIDAIKARAPIWKRESWDGGSAWGLDVHPLAGSGGAPRQSGSDLSSSGYVSANSASPHSVSPDAMSPAAMSPDAMTSVVMSRGSMSPGSMSRVGG